MQQDFVLYERICSARKKKLRTVHADTTAAKMICSSDFAGKLIVITRIIPRLRCSN